MTWVRAAALLLALGATLGPLLDAIHTHTGTTRYAAPWVLEMAWWVPLLFGSAGVAVGLPRAALERLRATPTSTPSSRSAAEGMGLFVLAYALSGVVPAVGPVPVNVARALALLAVFAVTWWRHDRTALGLGLACSTGLGGCVVEVNLSAAGAFEHLQPTKLGIPLWLPLLYATAQVGVGNLGRRLVEARVPAAVAAEPAGATLQARA